MRTRYDSNGGQLRLCAESKRLLNLSEPSQWRLDNLVAVQPHVIAPLLKYWSEHSSNIAGRSRYWEGYAVHDAAEKNRRPT